MVGDVKKDFLEKLGQWGRRYRYPCLILALGLLLMLWPTGKKQQTAATEPLTETAEDFDLDAFTQEAETLLGNISGAGQVKLLLSLDSDGCHSYLYDETCRQEEGEEEQEIRNVLIKQGSNEEPVTVSRSYPVFRGAVVICQGAGTPQVVLGLKEAISSLTGLGMDKITVLKMD